MMTGTCSEFRALRGAQAALAGDQFEFVLDPSHEKRLQDAALTDGKGEFLQRFRGDILARLPRALMDFLDGDLDDPAPDLSNRSFSRRRILDQRAQPAP